MHTYGLTIIIPVYNEAASITDLVKRVTRTLQFSDIPYEVIFVDDHSTDTTRARIKRFIGGYDPIRLFEKQGKQGKGYSIFEGYKQAKYSYIAMLDGDLQYPPEILPELFRAAKQYGFSVARRRKYPGSRIRAAASRINAFVFDKLLLGLSTDVQSGLKIFPREVFDQLDPDRIGEWSIDVPLVYTAYELGLTAGHVDIDFIPRANGESHVSILPASWEIATTAIRTRFSNRKIRMIPPEAKRSMLGSGVIWRRTRFITHTQLHHDHSALVTMTGWQSIVVSAIVAALTIGLIFRPLPTAIVFIAIISTIYFLDVIFNFYIVTRSLHSKPDILISDTDLEKIDEKTLPVYSVLVPLYREADVLPQFVDAMACLDYPKNKLDILLLLEEDDKHTIEAARGMNLPPYMRVVVVPHSLPKTKPKAANYGMALARGEYIVVYDAEDQPDPLQLKKAFLGFSKVSPDVVCLQAKLNYYNPRHNLLTRLFTAEYSLWFDVVLPGLQSIGTTIPLGGTSNHFRTKDLTALHGWDPFNVTEDCDLGVRLFKAGYKTAIIDSTTFEEANSDVKNWFRQRSRWIKGYFQTYLVHMRQPVQFTREQGEHALIFQLIVGGKIAFMLINPILWAVTISYFVLYAKVGAAIESLYPTWIFYMAAFSLAFGNFLYLYNYMIGLAKRGQWDLIKYIYLVPFYWLMISAGAVIALFQLYFRPHYWEKTIHGLHIGHDKALKARELMKMANARSRARRFQRLADFAGNTLVGGGVLVAATLLANILNFLYNAYLGRAVTLEEFGIISLIGSFIYIAQVPLGALSRSVTHKSAYLLGEYRSPIKDFWRIIRKKSIVWALGMSLVWLLIIPGLKIFFKTSDTLPFLLFTPVWFVGTLAAIDSGFLGGNLNFSVLAVILVTEAATKLLFTFLLVSRGFGSYVYAAIPLSMSVSFIVGWIAAAATRQHPIPKKLPPPSISFPKKFYSTSILMALTSVTYLSLDVVLAKHYLSAGDAGAYGFLSLIGKMVYFLSTLFSGFIVPILSRESGAGITNRKTYYRLLAVIITAHVAAYMLFGVFGYITVPILWGLKAVSIVPYLPFYSLSMVAFSLSATIIAYHQIKNEHLFPVVGFILGFIQVIGILFFHNSISQITGVTVISGITVFASVLVFDRLYEVITPVRRNALDLFGLFGRVPVLEKLPGDKKRILIFNWRDIRHVYAGGAEVYIHELSKRWVRMGNEVTVFCGNDGLSDRFESIDGVRIIRRGGTYFVYVWAMLYYIFRLRGNYDVIIDSENGIPFFTPLFAREQVYLLIHHVHQEVFRIHLEPPLSWVGQFLERRLMPLVYRNTEVLTVSPSSRDDILRHKLTKRTPHIIYNGVDLSLCKPGQKNKNPMVLYVGRLSAVKSIPVIIRAAKQIIKHVPQITIVVAGDGREKKRLQMMVHKLKLARYFTFKGWVSETEKISLYQKAWVFVNPSRIEGWGITTIEANACGTPVVASNVQGLRDAIRNPHTGFLVPYGSSNDFAKSILRLLKDDLLRNRMSEESIEWAKQFTWEKSVKQSLALFRGEIQNL